MQRPPVSVHFAVLIAIAAVFVAACCCDPSKKCIKDPPCRPCENPCCLSPIQKVALEGGTHALYDPFVTHHDGKTVIIFTEKGKAAWDKDPEDFLAKGVRSIKSTGTFYLDINPGPDVDLTEFAPAAVPAPK